MREFHDLVAALLDRDGSFRDLDFEAPTWSGVRDLLGALENSFEEVTGTSVLRSSGCYHPRSVQEVGRAEPRLS
jgi:hypothetical protein